MTREIPLAPRDRTPIRHNPTPPGRRLAQSALILGAGIALVAALRPARGRNVTALHRCEAEREEALRRIERLRGELQARVKSMLAAVRTLSSRTARHSEDVADFIAHFDGRLDALGRTQNMMARRGGDHIDLEELVREEMLAHAAWDEGQVVIQGAPLQLSARRAEAIAMAVHELAANAVKYGALSAPDGRIAVVWRIASGKKGVRLKFDWTESGVAVTESELVDGGFGRDLIAETLPRELGAKTSLEFAPGGLRCSIELPLTDRASALAPEADLSGAESK